MSRWVTALGSVGFFDLVAVIESVTDGIGIRVTADHMMHATSLGL